jgi:hypothetical protein
LRPPYTPIVTEISIEPIMIDQSSRPSFKNIPPGRAESPRVVIMKLIYRICDTNMIVCVKMEAT